MKLCILLGALFLIAPATSHSQAKYQVDRKASFRLKKDELRPVSLLMDSGMSAKIYIESNALLSFTVYNPAGEVLYADMTLSSSINWQFGAKMDGLYKIDFQNSSRFLANRVHYELIFEKYRELNLEPKQIGKFPRRNRRSCSTPPIKHLERHRRPIPLFWRKEINS